MRWLESHRDKRFETYDALWQWSVSDLEGFWQSIVDYFEVRFEQPPTKVLSSRAMPGAQWFAGAKVCYPEHVLRAEPDGPAIIARSEDGSRHELSMAELRKNVARIRFGLLQLGIGRGDRVAALVSNTPEAIVAMLATASLGAIWSSCPPEFGVESVLDRFSQIEPKVLITVDGYRFRGRVFDRREAVRQIEAGLPSLAHTVVVPQVGLGLDGALTWTELGATSAPLVFEPVAFDHPMWILYTSGTTGLPKPIVHGHGGILLEHFKVHALHDNVGRGDRFFWYSTTGWMMWNYLVSVLLVGSTIVLYDGDPVHPSLLTLFHMADEEGVTFFGTSASFLMACHKAGISPKSEVSLDRLKAIGSTGSPLPVEGFHWVYDQVKTDVWLGSVSGGTDVCTGLVVQCAMLPVRAGEIQCRALGAKIESFDESGQPVFGEVGELVITEPLPSMPIRFWNDDDGSRYRSSYFDKYDGVWRHGDWISIDTDGRSVIHGRSDATLNRGGVRLGTSEFYRVIETIPDIIDSIVVDTGTLDTEGRLWLFVAVADGAVTKPLAERIRGELRDRLSPRHVPDEIRSIPDVPYTLSGKKLEVPIKRILNGTPPEDAVNRGTLRNPDALDGILAAIETG